MQMRAIVYSFFLVFSLSFSSFISAKEAPDALLKRVTQELIAELRQQDKMLKKSPAKMHGVIERILVPYVDWYAMARWVVGRNAWAKASAEQRARFSQEFKDLLIRTYASTLQAYNNQTIEYLPIRGGLAGKDRVQVASLIRESGKEPIHVTYRLADKGESWKVYDITIEGVSLLKGFQSQFAQEIQQAGLEPLIQRLHQHNEKPLL